MKIEVNISKKYFAILLSAILLLGVVVFVNAVAIDKKVFHKTDQIDWEQGISRASYPTTFTGKGSSVKIGDGIQNDQYGKLTFGNGPGEYGGIGLKVTGIGSFLSLGTSNDYGLGITNEAMTIDPSGNVGIGTTSPSAKLDVNGNIHSDSLQIGTSSSISYVKGANPSCPAGTIPLLKRFIAKKCSGCEGCTTPSGWVSGSSIPQCNYALLGAGLNGQCNIEVVCTADSWTEVFCIGDN